MTTTVMPTAAEDLSDLGDGWHLWPYGHQWALAKRLDEGRYVAVVPMLFTWKLIVGHVALAMLCYDDGWCYRTSAMAVAAADRWSGVGEPTGWHRHPATGRRHEDAGALIADPLAPASAPAEPSAVRLGGTEEDGA